MSPTPPYVAVIFTSRRTPLDGDGYAVTADRMEELASRMPGYVGIVSARNDDGSGITVSYWADEAAARSWKAESEHLAAQALGRERWYESYTVEVATVSRRYSYDARRRETTEEPR